MLQYTDLFNSYKEDYEGIMTQVKKTMATNPNAEEINSCQSQLSHANQCLAQMEMEIRSMPNNPDSLIMIRLMRKEVDGLNKEVRQRINEYQKNALMQSHHSADGYYLDSEAREQRKKLLGMENQIRKNTMLLQDANMQMYENEETAYGTLRDIESQNEKLKNMRSKVAAVRTALNEAELTLATIARRAMQNKHIFNVICVILVVGVGIAIYQRI